MKKFFLHLFLLMIIASYAFAQQSGEASVRGLLAKQVRSWNNGDLDAFMTTYWNNDSLMFVGKSGVTYGYDSTLANYRRGYPDKKTMGTLQFDIIAIKKLSDEYYWVAGKWTLLREKDPVGGHYTLLLKKINGRWVIIADHTS